MEAILGINKKELESKKGIFTGEEINQQPEVWNEILDSLERNRESISKFIENFLKLPNKRIILTGAGSSAFAGEVVSPHLTKLLGLKVEDIATTDIVASPENYLVSDIPTLLISFARSGNSPESVGAVNLAEKLIHNLYQIVITCNKDGELSKKCVGNKKNLLLLMPEKCNDRSFAMTSSFSTMVLSCMAIFRINQLENLKKDVEKLGLNVEEFIKKNCKEIMEKSKDSFERIVYLGGNALRGIARESALKVLELTAGQVNAGYDTPLGFRHGPKSVINSRTVTVFYLSDNSYSRAYDIDLIKEMMPERKGNKIFIIGNSIPEEVKKGVDYHIELESREYSLDSEIYLPLQHLIFGQLLSFYKSCSLGITPDNPCPTGEVNRVVKGVNIYPYHK